MAEVHSVNGEPLDDSNHMVYNDATGNFEYDTQFYDYNEAEPAVFESDPQAPTAAFDWTDMGATDLPVMTAEATASGDFFTRPPLAPRSTTAGPAMTVGSETDSSARAATSAPAKKGSFSKMTNPLKGLTKPGKAGGKALNLGALKDKTKDAPRRPARDVNAANTSWNEAYNDGMWGDDQES